MKSYRVLCLMMLLAVFLLTGCDQYDIDDVQATLAKLNEYADIDISHSIILAPGSTITFRTVKKQQENNNMEMTDIDFGFWSSRSFYVNGYLCTESDGQFQVQETSDYEADAKKPVWPDFDFSRYDYDFSTKETSSHITYTILIKDADMQTMIEDILGQELPELINQTTFAATMELTVEKTTGNLKTLRFFATSDQAENSDSVEMVITVNAVGEAVNLVIPSAVTTAIDEYIRSQVTNTDASLG